MRPLIAVLLSAFLICFGGSSFAADDDGDFPGIRSLMSPEEFSASGLDALTPEQLEALDDWLVRYTAGEAEVVRSSSEEVREAEKEVEITSRLSSDFDGWNGDTIFRLSNGQIWRQRLRGNYSYRGSPAPEVRISKNFLGFFKMEIVETGKAIGVTRVR